MATKFCIQKFTQKFMQKFVEMWDTFCIHFLYISFDLQKVYIIRTVYTNDCKQNVTHILSHFEVFVLHFLGNYCT